MGGQHKNYPIINNIPEQREQASLLGPSLHVDHLKRKSDFLPRSVHLRAEGQQRRANTRSVNFLRSSCRNQFSFLVLRERRKLREACGLLSVNQESKASQ